MGMLFTGFMLTPSGPKVLEYNVRFGDPETEALMLLLSEDTDLAAVCLVRCRLVLNPYKLTNMLFFQACVERRLDAVEIKNRPGFAVSVVLASQGYPGSYAKGRKVVVGELPQGTLKSITYHAIPTFYRRCSRLPRRDHREGGRSRDLWRSCHRCVCVRPDFARRS